MAKLAVYKVYMLILPRKQKNNLTCFGSKFDVPRFDEKSFFNTLSSCTLYWDWKLTNAIQGDSPGEYTSERYMNLSTTEKPTWNVMPLMAP